MSGSEIPDDRTQSHIDFSPGVIVAHYRILRKIGAGGMGEVFLALDTKLNRQVALKFLPVHRAGDSETRTRFTREAQAVAKLNHSNIVTIHEVSEFDGRPFIAMEYVTGHALNHYCRDEKLSLSDIMALAIQVADGLAKAHQMGIIHRDIKPSNLVMDADHRAKILDFGLAAVQGADRLTKSGSTLGTIMYMSPEQAQGKELDPRSDLFSLGVVLYELITGQVPFKRESDAATLQAILSDVPEPLARYRAQVPDELQRIVSKLMERDPGLRYQTASDVVADLRKLSGTHAPLRVHPVGAKRRQPLWIFLAILGVLVVAGALFLRYRVRPDMATAPIAMIITPITSEGNVTTAAISPDGSYMAYATSDSSRQKLWVHHLSSGGTVQLLDTTNAMPVDLRFSPDGNFVYFRFLRMADLGDLYRISVLGGRPHLVIPDVWGRVTFSPQDGRMAFWRVKIPQITPGIVTANVDGSDDREWAADVAGEETMYSNVPAWSPDGKFIALSKAAITPSQQVVLSILEFATGKEVSRISGNWASTLSLDWIPAGGLIVAGLQHSNPFGAQVWRVSYPEGTLRRITNDLNSYNDVSLTADGKRLSVVQTDTRAGVWLVPIHDVDHPKQILSGKYDGQGGLSWADSNSLVFFTRTANVYSLSRYFIDHKTQETIIKGEPIVYYPSVSRGGQMMVFYDAGEQYSRISLCDLDGLHRKSLTQPGEFRWPSISYDGTWAVYCEFIQGNPQIVKTQIQGGSSLLLDSTAASQFMPRISPDGHWVAYYLLDMQSKGIRIAISPSAGGSPVHLFEVPPSVDAGFTSLVWSVDGESIYYQDLKNGVSNIWSQPVRGGVPSQITHFTDLYICDFDVSPDGKTLAVSRMKSTSDAVLIEGFD